MIIVFYDGKCGLCAKEISHYKKIALTGIFHWQDITQSIELLEKEGIRFADGLKLLHVKSKDGTLHIGVDAFIIIWKQLKRWRWLALFISLPVIRQLARMIYRVFAHWRFKRLAHCQLALNKKPS